MRMGEGALVVQSVSCVRDPVSARWQSGAVPCLQTLHAADQRVHIPSARHPQAQRFLVLQAPFRLDVRFGCSSTLQSLAPPPLRKHCLV